MPGRQPIISKGINYVTCVEGRLEKTPLRCLGRIHRSLIVSVQPSLYKQQVGYHAGEVPTGIKVG